MITFAKIAEKIMPHTSEKGFLTGRSLPLIELEGADILNDGNLILSGVNLKVRRGDFIYLVGRVGSGKSSIIKTLTAELPLMKGEGRVGDYNLKTIKKKQIPFLRRNIGVVFQDFQLIMDQTVTENLMFVLRSTGWTAPAEMERKCAEVLKLVGMQTKAHKLPHQLSGGEQQRIAIARALLNSPDIILADEPTGNLDSETAEVIMDLLMQIHKQYSPAILMVTHNRALIEKYPEKVFICSNGECRELKTANNVDNDSDEDELRGLTEDMPDDFEDELAEQEKQKGQVEKDEA